MPNGKPGDHPLTDILAHDMTVFTPQIDNLIGQIVALGGKERLEAAFNLFQPPPTSSLRQFRASPL